MFQNRRILSPNLHWPECRAPIPEVAAYATPLADRLQMRWEVQEGEHTFRCEVTEDGGPCWQDSCVELFLLSLDQSGTYVNFEFNARGVCLGARGTNRHLRSSFDKNAYSRILRRPSLKAPPEKGSGPLSWSLDVDIPADLFGAAPGVDLRNCNLFGNIYKCGDKSDSAHWLSAFPIDTPKPDFHRPEFFRNLNYH